MFACYHELRKHEFTDFNDWHNGHSTHGAIKDSMPKSTKEEIKERLNEDNQGPSSLLLAMERKHNLNLSSKQTCDLKNKGFRKEN